VPNAGEIALYGLTVNYHHTTATEHTIMEAILNQIDSYIEHIMDDEKLSEYTQIQSKR
jgi:hypothetical protein